jgi:hypothetical protein
VIKKRGGNILVYDLQGNFLRTISIPSQASDYLVFVTLPDERIALLDNWNDKIYFINSLGNLLAIVNILDEPDSHLQNLDGIIVGNRLIFLEDGKRNLLQINLSNYERSIFKDLSSLPQSPSAITYANGQYYLCGSRVIYSFTEDSYVTQIAEIPEGSISSIVIVNSYAYVSVNISFTGKIYKVDLDNGTTNLFVPNLDYPLKDLEAILIQP